jgi:hypothetical protein
MYCTAALTVPCYSACMYLTTLCYNAWTVPLGTAWTDAVTRDNVHLSQRQYGSASTALCIDISLLESCEIINHLTGHDNGIDLYMMSCAGYVYTVNIISKK